MQATARSRRLFQLRGSTSAVQGRHRLASTVVVQMVVGEDDETEGGIMRHKLPNKKKRSHPGSEHSLQSAVKFWVISLSLVFGGIQDAVFLRPSIIGMF